MMNINMLQTTQTVQYLQIVHSKIIIFSASELLYESEAEFEYKKLAKRVSQVAIHSRTGWKGFLNGRIFADWRNYHNPRRTR